jgi:hypothetical protein
LKLNGSKHSPNLICSQLCQKCNYHLLLILPPFGWVCHLCLYIKLFCIFYYFILSQGGVTVDGVLDWRLDLLTTLTMPNYIAIADVHTLHISTAHTKSFQSAVSSPVVAGNGFQRRTLPLLWVPELSPCLSYQLLTATARNDRTAAVL